jgi:ABC-type multidrug transport system fused ATPase/permease subunit
MTLYDTLISALRKRRRMPRSGDGIYGRGTDVGDVGSNSLNAFREELMGLLLWMGTRRTRKLIKRFHRYLSRAGAMFGTELSGILKRGESEQPLSFVVSTTVGYIVLTMVAMAGLEAAMMWLSTSVFDQTLGIGRYVMAITAGVLLYLPGHFVGDLIHHAEFSRSRAKKVAMPAAALVLLIVAATAIFQMGSGRDANLRATQLTNHAATLSIQAESLDTQATNLAHPAHQAEHRPNPSREDRQKIRALRAQEASDEHDALALNQKAESMKTLKFFAFIQLLAVIAGAVGGYFYAAAAATRRARRERWWARKAMAIRGRMISIVAELLGYTMASHGTAGVKIGGNDHRWLLALDPGASAAGDASVKTMGSFIETIVDHLLGDVRLPAPTSAPDDPSTPKTDVPPESSGDSSGTVPSDFTTEMPGTVSSETTGNKPEPSAPPAATDEPGRRPAVQRLIDQIDQQDTNGDHGTNPPESTPGASER